MGEEIFILLQWSVSDEKYGICLFTEQNDHIPNTSLFLQLHWSHFLTSYKFIHFTASICYVYLGGTDRWFHDVLECVLNHPDKMQIIIWPLTCKLLSLQPENNLPGHFSLTMGLWIVQTSLFQICFLSSGL